MARATTQTALETAAAQFVESKQIAEQDRATMISLAKDAWDQGVSVTEIARQAGVIRPTVYRWAKLDNWIGRRES